MTLPERSHMKIYVFVYLAAIVAANLSIAHWGPKAAVYNAFLLIALDLVTRDTLHDSWGRTRRGLWLRMGALVAGGSILSYLAALWFLEDTPVASVERIALGSFLAFAAGATLDALVYQASRRTLWLERSNRSNVAGAAADSLVFQTFVFGWSFPLIFAQFTAKVAGGVVWSLLLDYRLVEVDLAGRNFCVSSSGPIRSRCVIEWGSR
jgi:uncharacterized PurR-regulated membrane protein YhhQ (DUF165 family)